MGVSPCMSAMLFSLEACARAHPSEQAQGSDEPQQDLPANAKLIRSSKLNHDLLHGQGGSTMLNADLAPIVLIMSLKFACQRQVPAGRSGGVEREQQEVVPGKCSSIAICCSRCKHRPIHKVPAHGQQPVRKALQCSCSLPSCMMHAASAGRQ